MAGAARLAIVLAGAIARRPGAEVIPTRVPAAWLPVFNGRWKSPARRPVGWAATASLPAAGVPACGAYHAGINDELGRPARVAEASHVSG
jgi:hypothetical protein